MSADGQRLPFVDGVLILYDVTNQASISKLPESLGEYFLLCAPGLSCIFSFLVILADHGSNKLEAFARVQLPALVVSCKCDAPQRQINPSSIEQVGTVSGYETMQTSAALPDSQKKCVNVVLGMIIRKNGLSFFAFVLYRCLAAVALCWLAFCLFSFLVSAKLDNDPRWVGKCLFCFGCEYHFPYQFFYLVASARAGKLWRIISLGLAGEMFLSFALSSHSFHSMPAHPLALSIWSLLKGKGQGYFVNGLF